MDRHCIARESKGYQCLHGDTPLERVVVLTMIDTARLRHVLHAVSAAGFCYGVGVEWGASGFMFDMLNRHGERGSRALKARKDSA
jgi:hypothetical protein